MMCFASVKSFSGVWEKNLRETGSIQVEWNDGESCFSPHVRQHDHQNEKRKGWATINYSIQVNKFFYNYAFGLDLNDYSPKRFYLLICYSLLPPVDFFLLFCSCLFMGSTEGVERPSFRESRMFLLFSLFSPRN
jgi:hypothetical protein